MKDFIFLTNHYLPKPGATGLCVHQIAKTLKERGHRVQVVCYDNGDANNSQFDGVNIIRVKEPFYFTDYSEKNVLRRRVARLFSLLAKLLYINSYPKRSSLLIKKFEIKLDELLLHNMDSIVVSTYTPLEACAALLEAKKKYPLIKAVYYSTDTLSNEKGNSGFISPERRTKLGLRWEHKIFSVFDKLLIMECHERYYRSNIFKPYFDKYLIANFPLLIAPIHRSVKKSSVHERKLLVYAGTLYKELRNPEYLCKLLYRAGQQLNFDAIFIGGGDCKDIVGAFSEKSNAWILHKGMVPHDEAVKYISEADVLLSIGNKESPMAPSKIYEYMATCKPIIHIYTWDMDPCLEPLRKYGNSLLIKEDNDFPVDTLVEFIKTSKLADNKDVFYAFRTSTPEYTADLLEKI